MLESRVLLTGTGAVSVTAVLTAACPVTGARNVEVTASAEATYSLAGTGAASVTAGSDAACSITGARTAEMTAGDGATLMVMMMMFFEVCDTVGWSRLVAALRAERCGTRTCARRRTLGSWVGAQYVRKCTHVTMEPV